MSNAFGVDVVHVRYPRHLSPSTLSCSYLRHTSLLSRVTSLRESFGCYSEEILHVFDTCQRSLRHDSLNRGEEGEFELVMANYVTSYIGI